MHAPDPPWETIKREFDAACSQAARAARCQVTNELNQILRRLRQYETEAEWVSAVLDGASRFVQQVAIFDVNNAVLTLRGQRKLSLAEHLSFPAASAAAFATVIETQDSVIALRTPGEVTESLSSPDAGARAHVIPVMNAGPRGGHSVHSRSRLYGCQRSRIDCRAGICRSRAAVERRCPHCRSQRQASRGRERFPPRQQLQR